MGFPLDRPHMPRSKQVYQLIGGGYPASIATQAKNMRSDKKSLLLLTGPERHLCSLRSLLALISSTETTVEGSQNEYTGIASVIQQRFTAQDDTLVAAVPQ